MPEPECENQLEFDLGLPPVTNPDPTGQPNAANAASPPDDQTLIAQMIDAAGTPLTKPRTDALLQTMLPTIWGLYADKDRVYPRLRYWYTLRQVIDVWMVSVFRDVDTEEAGVKDDLSDQSKNLAAIRANCDTEIAALERKAMGSRTAAIGLISAGQCSPLAGALEAFRTFGGMGW